MTEILAFIKKYYSFLFFIIIIILSIIIFQTCSTLKKERTNNEYKEKQNTQNLSSLKDSIVVEFNKKLKAFEYSKDNYVVQKLSDLEKYDKGLYDEIKNIKGDVIAAIKTDVQGDLGGISTSNGLSVIDEKANHYGLNFKTDYKDSGFEQLLVGTSKFYIIPNETTKKWTITPDVTVLDTNLTVVKITYGFKELKDKYQVFAISPSNKIKLTELDGAYFINKQPAAPSVSPKKWGIGPYIGYGLNTGNSLNSPSFGWSIGLSFHYDFFQMRFGK